MQVNDNASYHLVEMDGTTLWLLTAGKRIKIFKRREDSDIYLLFEKNIKVDNINDDIHWRMLEDA